MEGTKCELRTGPADRLRRNDTDSRPGGNKLAGSQVTSVTACTHSTFRLTGKHRSDLHRFDGCFRNSLRPFLVDNLARLDNDLAAERIGDIMNRNTAKNSLSERFFNVLTLLQGTGGNAHNRPAVIFRDDRVLCHVNEAACQVTGVCRLQSRICQTFSGSMCRDEVFENREPFAEVCRNGVLDELACRTRERLLRLRHETTHSGQLTHLLLGSSRA